MAAEKHMEMRMACPFELLRSQEPGTVTDVVLVETEPGAIFEVPPQHQAQSFAELVLRKQVNEEALAGLAVAVKVAGVCLGGQQASRKSVVAVVMELQHLSVELNQVEPAVPAGQQVEGEPARACRG